MLLVLAPPDQTKFLYDVLQKAKENPNLVRFIIDCLAFLVEHQTVPVPPISLYLTYSLTHSLVHAFNLSPHTRAHSLSLSLSLSVLLMLTSS